MECISRLYRCSRIFNSILGGEKMRITRCNFIWQTATFAGGLVLARPLRIVAEGAGMEEPVVETTYGKVRGYMKDGVYTFKGIRYGALTAGTHRFMPPQKPKPWSDVQDCLALGPMAPQPVLTACFYSPPP
jgi:hypothetical protein